MKKVIVVLILLICGGLITGFEIEQIKKTQLTEMLPVVVLKNEVRIGTNLSSNDLEIKLVNEDLVSEETYQNISEALGKTLAITLKQNTILSKSLVTEETYYTPLKGYAMTALKLTPEEMLCWEIAKGESVDIIHIDVDGTLVKIGSVIVKSYYDQSAIQNMGKDNLRKENIPIYLLVEGERDVIESIIKLKGVGRLEATKSN